MSVKNSLFKKLVAALLLCVLLSLSFSIVCSAKSDTNTSADADKNKSTSMYGDKFIMVSLGDSFSSGEGNEKYYGQDSSYSEKVKNQDWLAHRSQNSWASKLTSKYVDGTMSEHRCLKDVKNTADTQWYFYASSGAVINDFYNKQKKTYNFGNKDSNGNYEYSKTDVEVIDSQLSVFDNIEAGEVDYVTFSVVGNDLGFVEIVSKAANPFESNFLCPNKLPELLASKIELLTKDGGYLDKLSKLYDDIEAKAGKQAHIIVVGYPELFNETAASTYYQISKKEAGYINQACRILNNYLSSLVTKKQLAGMNIHYVSVIDDFKDRGVGASDSYMNPIELWNLSAQDIDQTSKFSSSCCHPNEKGVQAYADAVQEVIDEIEATEIEASLVIDTSGSMSGTPISETKKAAESFCQTIFESGKSSSVGLIGYSGSAHLYCDFSFSSSKLTTAINKLSASGNTNTGSGLQMAYESLKNSKAEKRIIILMSDGLPNVGLLDDSLISLADEIKNNGIEIYSLGFFQSLSSDKANAQKLMKALASDSKNYYDVDSAENLVYFFGDISSQISGQKYIYIQIACPVNVRVSYGGETLSSKDSTLNTRTSFGTLTFEAEEQEEDEEDESAKSSKYKVDSDDKSDGNDTDDTDDTVKILRLKDGVDYEISIDGYGRGKMDYTISYMDDDGEYTDVRKFKNISITKKTAIETGTDSASKTVLRVDSDGDGVTDIVYKAGKNERGKEVQYYYVYVLIGAVALLIAGFVLIIKLSDKKHSKRKPN